jgi:thioredoxin reductase (NADPH)
MSTSDHDVIVIGEGISGLTAANVLAEGGVRVATFEAQMYGGLILNVNELRPGPDEQPMSGSEFTAGLMETNAELGVQSIQEPVISIGTINSGIEVRTASTRHQARHLVLACGARLKKLGVPGEAQFEGRGVSQCADCDGPLNHGTDVVVVGGGDSALQEALVLTHFSKKVFLIVRSDQFRARSEFVNAVQSNAKIQVIKNARVTSISGGKVVQSVSLTHSDGRKDQLPCTAVFSYVGLEPNADFLPAEITRDNNGFVVTDDDLRTAWPLAWAAGAVRSGFSGLVPDAIAEGKRIGQSILALLSSQD